MMWTRLDSVSKDLSASWGLRCMPLCLTKLNNFELRLCRWGWLVPAEPSKRKPGCVDPSVTPGYVVVTLNSHHSVWWVSLSLPQPGNGNLCIVSKLSDNHVIAGINFIVFFLKTTIEKYLYTIYKSIIDGEVALFKANRGVSQPMVLRAWAVPEHQRGCLCPQWLPAPFTLVHSEKAFTPGLGASLFNNL